METRNTPRMTADKAVWTAMATAVTSVALYFTGMMPVDVAGFSEDASQAATLIAAVLAQAAVAGLTAFYKRNYLK